MIGQVDFTFIIGLDSKPDVGVSAAACLLGGLLAIHVDSHVTQPRNNKPEAHCASADTTSPLRPRPYR